MSIYKIENSEIISIIKNNKLNIIKSKNINQGLIKYGYNYEINEYNNINLYNLEVPSYSQVMYKSHNENSDFDNKDGVEKEKEKEKRERPRIGFKRS